MKRMLPQILLIAVVAVAWVAGIGTAATAAIKDADAEQRIEEAEDLETYKTVLDLYDQMIRENPDDITWRERKADAYYAMGANNSFISTCEELIEAFPSDPLGYLKLMTYYEETGRVDKLLSTCLSAPESVQADSQVAELYQMHEYDYKVVSAQFGDAGQFQGDKAVVLLDGYEGYVDADASVVIECDYDDARPFIGDRAAVFAEKEWYLIDKDGDRIAASHDLIEDLYSPNDGYALAKVDGVYGYYDENLKNPVHFEYEDATSFANGVAAVKKDGKWALIDTSFDEKTGFVFDGIMTDFTGVCCRKGRVFAKEGGAWHLYDEDGKRLAETSFENAELFYDDLAAVEQGGKWGFVDASGNLAIECTFDGAHSFAMGMGGVEQGGSWGFVNSDGDIVVEPQFKDVSPLSQDGLSSVSLGETMRYIQFYKFSFEGE